MLFWIQVFPTILTVKYYVQYSMCTVQVRTRKDKA